LANLAKARGTGKKKTKKRNRAEKKKTLPLRKSGVPGTSLERCAKGRKKEKGERTVKTRKAQGEKIVARGKRILRR